MTHDAPQRFRDLSPRAMEIVTGHRAAKRIPDRACELAGMSMRAAFAGGDLAGGIVVGLRMLADRARVG